MIDLGNATSNAKAVSQRSAFHGVFFASCRAEPQTKDHTSDGKPCEGQESRSEQALGIMHSSGRCREIPCRRSLSGLLRMTVTDALDCPERPFG